MVFKELSNLAYKPVPIISLQVTILKPITGIYCPAFAQTHILTWRPLPTPGQLRKSWSSKGLVQISHLRSLLCLPCLIFLFTLIISTSITAPIHLCSNQSIVYESVQLRERHITPNAIIHLSYFCSFCILYKALHMVRYQRNAKTENKVITSSFILTLFLFFYLYFPYLQFFVSLINQFFPNSVFEVY